MANADGGFDSVRCGIPRRDRKIIGKVHRQFHPAFEVEENHAFSRGKAGQEGRKAS
jgi:hypothetical protein